MNIKTSTKKHLCKWCNNCNPDFFYSREKSICKFCKIDINKIQKSFNRGTFDKFSNSFVRMSSFGYTLHRSENSKDSSDLNNNIHSNKSSNFVIDDKLFDQILKNPVIFNKLIDSFKPHFITNYEFTVVCDQVQYLSDKL